MNEYKSKVYDIDQWQREQLVRAAEEGVLTDDRFKEISEEAIQRFRELFHEYRQRGYFTPFV